MKPRPGDYVRQLAHQQLGTQDLDEVPYVFIVDSLVEYADRFRPDLPWEAEWDDDTKFGWADRMAARLA